MKISNSQWIAKITKHTHHHQKSSFKNNVLEQLYETLKNQKVKRRENIKDSTNFEKNGNKG